MQRLTRIIAIVVVCMLALGGFFAFRAYSNRDKTALISIEFAPKSASAVIGENNIKQGAQKVLPGTYNIVISKNGFKTKKITVTLKKGDNGYTGVVLESDSPDTKDWFDRHPDDQKLAEKISSRNYDAESDKASKIPILADLPFVGPGEYFRIDYNGLTDKGQASISITFVDEESKDDALLWMETQGYKAADYDIAFVFKQPEDSGETGD